MTTPPCVFLSYSHDDDEDEWGFITKFANHLERSFKRLGGTDLAVFHDHSSIQWGDEWRARIDEGLDASVAFIAFVTPRYLGSEECRLEFDAFQRRHATTGGRFLPLYYVDVDEFDTLDDPVMSAVRATQWSDWRKLREVRDKDKSLKVRKEIELLAKRIREVVGQAAGAPAYPSGPMSEPSREFRATTASPDHDSDWLDALVAAQAAREDEEYALARALLLSCLDVDDEPQLWLELAVVDWYAGAWDDAVAEFETALAKGVPRGEVLHGRGQVRIELGQYMEGVADLTEVIEGGDVDETVAYARSSRALGLGGLGRFDEALRELADAETVTPYNAWLHFSRAVIMGWRGDDKGAAESYLRSLICDAPRLNRHKRMFAQQRLGELGWAD